MPIRSAPLKPTVEVLRSGETTPSEYTDERLELLETADTEIRAFVSEADRRSRVTAATTHLERRFDDPGERPLLYGVPVGVKDTIHVDQLPTRAGSDFPVEELSGPESPAVTALCEAGAVVLGKTVTTKFASLEPGPTRNPHDTERTPGGSSSGSAAAVAAGMVPLAVGTQTAGSVVRPAAYCGVVGFKPSFGRIATDGMLPVSESADHVGLFTQDVEGMRLAASIVCPNWDATAGPDGRPVVGIPTGEYVEQVTDVGRNAFEEAVETLEMAGYELRRARLFDDVANVNQRHERLLNAEFALTHHEWHRDYPDHYAESTVDLIEEGRRTSIDELGRARAARTDARESVESTMEENGIDAVISPSTPGPAPAGLDDTGDPRMSIPWTHAGLPTVTVPSGRTEAGLPLGLRCSTRYHDDERLLAWAETIAAEL